MISFFLDLVNFLKYKSQEKKYNVGFFCESSFISEYLKPYISKINTKRKVVIISFEKIENNILPEHSCFVFRSNFFRELVFLTLKLNVLYSSTPDIENTIFKRSRLKKNCKYIYIQHSPVSLTMIYREKSFEYFDAIQVISKFQEAEINEMKIKDNFNIKVFKSKYLFINKKKTNFKKNCDVLLAPTWNSGFFDLNCHKLLKKHMDKNHISYILRPHPMSFKKKEISLENLDKLNIPVDSSNTLDLNKYSFLVSDWSGIFIEYALLSNQKAFLIDTPKKIKNKNYKKYKNQPIEIAMRNKFGKTYNVNNLEILVKDILNLKEKKLYEDESLKKFINVNFF
mgnify:CR=1 FL=1